jgi:hypothetical protein
MRKPPGGAMFEFVTSEPAMMHAAIILSAKHFVFLGGSETTILPAFYHHKLQAIQVVNARLGDCVMATADGTLGVVASLTILEV